VAFISVMEVSYWLPKNLRDMTQVHLVIWSPIFNSYCVDCKQPFPPPSKLTLWSGHYQTHAITCYLHYSLHLPSGIPSSNASLLT
jgi:hypothetical protein